MKLALSMLCENPLRRTGLSTLFPEFVGHALRLYPEVDWIVFAGENQPWSVDSPRVEVCRKFPANDRMLARLWADHFGVAAEARGRGAAALLTVGFCPLRTSGLPVVMHVFSLRHRNGIGPRTTYRRRAIARGLRRAALVIANSRWAASQLDVPPARLLVSHEGIQADRFKTEGAAGIPGLSPGYLLWVSNLYPYKRLGLCLAAYARLPPALRSQVPLVIAGGDWAGGRARAEAEAARLGLGGHVRFVGWVDDGGLPALYRGARAHVLSTAEETFGRSVLEAMACGCPCVLQDLPVLREVTGGAASFVDFEEPARSAAALEAILTDPALAGRLRTEGIRRAADFGFDKLARERVGAILAVLGGSGGS